MQVLEKLDVAIIDYHMGNLFSVQQACQMAGLSARITNSKEEILSAESVILPGVGAFGDAMGVLEDLELVPVLREIALEKHRPFIGICLGMQLLMSESYEFGHHQGLNIIKGKVVPFDNPRTDSGRKLKVPQVEWNRIFVPKNKAGKNLWDNFLLSGIKEGSFMYFVHSFYVEPEDKDLILSISHYGNIEFCSSLHYGNIFTFQFHPERSSRQGLQVYKNLANIIKHKKSKEPAAGV